MRTRTIAAVALAWALAPSSPLAAQLPSTLQLRGPSGEERSVEVATHRGYAAASTDVLRELGWRVEVGQRTVTASLGDRADIRLRPGSPFFHWDGRLHQLVEAPYFFGERLYVPLQLFTGFLPRMLDDTYARDAGGPLRALDAVAWSPPPPRRSAEAAAGSRAGDRDAGISGPEAGSGASAGMVVIIDPGHGGKDTGALGPAGILEKEVALGVARALARELEGTPGLEVHLTREDDTLVPLWQRGEQATQWKGERPGVFVSLHANAAARSSSVRGFETYFLSEARTDHEQRVAALENSVVAIEAGDESAGTADPDLGFILSDLRNRDHQRWSAELARMIQDELRPVHPGPDRGVKQGPFAVITNALMPSVLVELGFITHPDEARLLSSKEFQEDVARSLGRALTRFMGRYPPGGSGAAIGGRR